MEKKIKLDEDFFDDIHVIAIEPGIGDPLKIPGVDVDNEPLPGPETGADSGLSELLIDLINDEWEAIQGYNTFKANVGEHTEFIPLIDDIAAEENNHVGMLQKMLATLSPNVNNIAEGEAEAQNELGEAAGDIV